MASPFVTIAVKNDASVVINAVVSAVVDNQKVSLNQGNYPKDQTKTFQLPGIATDISLVIKYEAFIDDWKTAYSETQPETTSWQSNNAGFEVTGPVDAVNVSGPSWS
jgi:hypothetical protein